MALQAVEEYILREEKKRFNVLTANFMSLQHVPSPTASHPARGEGSVRKRSFPLSHRWGLSSCSATEKIAVLELTQLSFPLHCNSGLRSTKKVGPFW